LQFWLVIVTIIVTIACGIVSHRIALHKEGDLVFWGIIGFLAGPAGVLLTWALAGREWGKSSTSNVW